MAKSPPPDAQSCLDPLESATDQAISSCDGERSGHRAGTHYRKWTTGVRIRELSAASSKGFARGRVKRN
ncbi:hypothetical protein FXV83_40085 [Bradyrhizobium hipponense]|uniref:Uncharacterized protein n=1 Tax=Bradyrhizobium hipponense TaxID=2605638 RepID=A0A5S4YCW7_9BRAD|nr:hypothetical protein FXV83_40085 [Bradyrhizobium hipponense]